MSGRHALPNPFPGLRPFRESEEHLFFGRESQVDRMIDKLAATHFLAVVGTSGSGKSSLVNCGLRPSLHRGLMAQAGTWWRMAQFRPGGTPLRAMAKALAEPGVLFDGCRPEGLALEQIVETTLRMSNLGLTDIYEQAHLDPGTNVLIVVDQFEELFRYRTVAGSERRDPDGSGSEATSFVNLLLEPQNHPDYPIYVVLTMRSDFLGDCAQFQGLPEAINESQYLIPRMTREERRAAIAGPIAVVGGEISPVLLTRLVNDVGDNPDQLSILQHALNRTWARWQHEGGGLGAVALEHYDAIGTMAHALDRHAEKAYEELADERQRRICQRVFKALTDKGSDARGIRRPTGLQTLCALAGASVVKVTEVLGVFRKPSRSFLMPPLPQTLEPDTIIDISHESLMRVWERLRTWVEEEAESARMYRRVAETATLHAAGKAGLWGDPDLQVALDWRRTNEPTAAWAEQYQGGFEAAMSFLDRSKEVLDEARAETKLERRWRRGWRPVLAVAALALALFLWNLEWHSGLEQRLTDLIPFPAEKKGVVAALRKMLLPILLGTPYFLAYLGLAHYGKRAFRRIAFPKIFAEVAANTKKPVETARPADKGVVDAALVLETTYAGFGRRLWAWCIDGIIVLVIFSFCAVPPLEVALGGMNVTNGQTAPAQGALTTRGLLDFYPLFAFLLLDWLYQTASISSRRQATWGKQLARILVTDVRGRRLTFSRATVRYFAKLLSYYGMIGFLMQPFTKNRQALHDKIAKSVVLLRPAVEGGRRGASVSQ